MGQAEPRISVSFHNAKLCLMMACACAAWPSVALANDPRVDELARQLRDVQSQLNALKAAPAGGADLKALQDATAAQMAQLHKKMDAQTHISMPNGRLSVVSSDSAFSLALRATVQFDAGYFSHDRTLACLAGRARPHRA